MDVFEGSPVELLEDGLCVGTFVGAVVSGILEGCDVGALVGLPVILMASYLKWNTIESYHQKIKLAYIVS